MDKPEELWAAFEDMLPEGAVAIAGWRVISYMEAEGSDSKLYMSVHGEPSLTDTVGNLHNAAFLAQFSAFSYPNEPEVETGPDGPSD